MPAGGGLKIVRRPARTRTPTKMTTPKPFLVSVEGNIGSGKSTLLRELRKRNPTWHFIDEPVESWMSMINRRGESLLELFYKDKRRWAFTFQQTAFLTRLLATKNAIAAWRAAGCPGSPVFIMERCVQTDAHVFAKMLAAEGDMDDLEFGLYARWFDAFVTADVSPNAYILVDTPVTVCHERIARRARAGEGGDAIPIEYLDRLDSAHFAWLLPAERGPSATVIRYDNSSKDLTPLENVEEDVKEMCRLAQ